MDAIFKLAGLDHVKNTVVGNADIRGVSGGQKRRVKMLELAVGMDVTVMFLDEITNGTKCLSSRGEILADLSFQSADLLFWSAELFWLAIALGWLVIALG